MSKARAEAAQSQGRNTAALTLALKQKRNSVRNRYVRNHVPKLPVGRGASPLDFQDTGADRRQRCWFRVERGAVRSS
jgi:hypothetical protein